MPKLTRQGARNLTATLDRVATVIQNNPDLLGVDKKIAMDFARRCDLLSDAIETTAVINFPKSAAIDETGLSVEPLPGDEGFDANEIGDEVPGPLEIITPPDEPWMGGHFTQEKYVQLSEKQESGELAAAAAAGTKLAALLEARERSFSAASGLDNVVVKGYSGFTEQIRQMEELTTQIQSLQAQIDASVGPLLANKKLLDKELAEAIDKMKAEYKENLTAQGNVTIERKTALVEARAMLKVTSTKRSLDKVQGELLAAVTDKYGAEVATFIRTQTQSLQDMKKDLRIAFQGLELQQKALKTATVGRQAGIAELLTRFQGFIVKNWKKMVSVVQNATKVLMAVSGEVEDAHNAFMDVLAGKGKTASRNPGKFAGFNLFE